MNANTVVVPKTKKRQSVGSQVFVIIVFSVLAGSSLEKALLRYAAPRQTYGWTEDVILGIGFLLGTIALAFRLRRDATAVPPDAQVR
jgi:hypothetical protein